MKSSTAPGGSDSNVQGNSVRAERQGRSAVRLGCAILPGLALTVLIALVLLGRADTIPACEAVTAAAPDFEVSPFAFDPEKRAHMFVQALADDDFETAYGMLALERLGRGGLCEVDLEESWRVIAADHSALTGIERFSPLAYDAATDHLRVALHLALSGSGQSPGSTRDAYVSISLTPDGRIGWFSYLSILTDLGPAPESPPPPYAPPESFDEFPVTIGRAPWELGGTLSVPKGRGPFPAVVILGPSASFAGESPNRWDRDLAQGLATHGVASLRFSERSVAHALAAAREPTFTLAEEYVDDALAAIRQLRQSPRVDPARIYLLGASTVSFAMPRVASQDQDLTGLIFVSPSSGYVWDSAWRIQQEQAKVDRSVTESEKLGIEVLQARAAAVEAAARGDGDPKALGVRIHYHLDLRTYRPEDVARYLPIPMFVVFGDRIGITPIEDHEAWLLGLRRRGDAAFRVYKGHVHGLFDVRQASPPALRSMGHVDEEVMIDIAAWIEGGWPHDSCGEADAYYAGCHGG